LSVENEGEQQDQEVEGRHTSEEEIQTMTIGRHNVFEVGCHCEALTMGNHNVFEAKSFVGKSVTITDGCVIGAKCQIDIKETIPNNTVIFGEKCVRRQQASHPPAQTLQLDFLTKILPNFHHMMKSSKKT
jgi:dynactin-6